MERGQKRWRTVLFALWAWAMGMSGIALADTAMQLNEWRGEHLDKREGAFFLALRLQGFPGGRQASPVTGDVRIVLWNLLTKESFFFSVPLRALSARLPSWKLPSGKYAITRLELVDARGQRRQLTTAPERLLVKRQILSNFGQWTLRPKGKAGLAMRMDMVANPYKEDGPKRNSRIAAVINGYSGMIQEVFGGKALLQRAEDDFQEKDQLRRQITHTRQIAMFYKLDLFKHNQHAPAVADVLNVYDGSLRDCYSKREATAAGLSGQLVFKFVLSGVTGTMRKITYAGGNLKDPQLMRCMVQVLSQIPFPAPETMLGELTYTFDVK